MGITRVQYRERQRLTASDLRAEQEYRLGLAGLHHLGPHDWGVVRGLRLRRIDGNRFELGRGTAVDGYGRELLVAQPIDFTIDGFDDNQCWCVAIYYCEDPAPSRERECQERPPPRIRSRVALQVVDELPDPGGPPNYLAARAAGAIADALPWPVLVGRVGLGCTGLTGESPLFDYSTVRYVRHRAAHLRTPTGHARLQLGVAGTQDSFQFLVSTRDEQNALARRLGIDRDGTFHVWKPLAITGAEAAGFASLDNNVQLRIRMPMPAGLGGSLRIDGLVDAELRNITASLQPFGPALFAPGTLAAEGTLQKESAPLLFGGFSLASVSVLDTAGPRAPRPFAFSAARKRFRTRAARLLRVAAEAGEREPELPKLAFSMLLSPTGGELYPHVAVQFRPAAALEPDPSQREIHAVVTSASTDSVPRTGLRISGGEADSSDASGRVSAGARTAAGAYLAALRMDGRGGLRLVAAPDVDTPKRLLSVEGAVYLPAIGKNDAMLPDLLTLAHMCGLVQIGNVTADPELTLEKNTTGDGHYDLVIKMSPGVKLKRVLELIFGDKAAGPADMSIRALEDLDVPDTANDTRTNKITVPGLAPSGRRIRVAVLALAEVGGKTRVAIGRSLELDIP